MNIKHYLYKREMEYFFVDINIRLTDIAKYKSKYLSEELENNVNCY